MEKTIFLANFDKNFFFVTSLCSVPQKNFVELSKKIIFFIFKVNLYFNDLYPFLYFMLNIFQKIELR